MENGVRFLQGLMAGALGTLAVGLALIGILGEQQLVALPGAHLIDPAGWVRWVFHNLGWSIPVFVLLLGAYFFTLERLRQHLDSAADGKNPKLDRPDVNGIVQLDQLVDTWTALFFGTGVIWTAIGMRSALIYALGDRDLVLSAGAFSMLERMIDGGILLALSTTIVGGIGGYLMRVYKTMTVGAALTRRYDEAARADTSAMRASLRRIERRLGSPTSDVPRHGAAQPLRRTAVDDGHENASQGNHSRETDIQGEHDR
ncbi:MAG: hypothetical protein AAFX56_11850 [Pseudomonadota bacterium]